MAGENDNFDDLPALGPDGTGNEDLDQYIDQQIDGATGAGKQKPSADDEAVAGAGARGAKARAPANKGEEGADDGQVTSRPAQRGTVPSQPRQIGSMFRAGADNAIYDAQGQRVAQPGLERRVFERVHRYYAGMEQQNAALQQRVQNFTDANEAAKREGLSIEESAMGLRLAAAWKKDPLQTINFLLTQAQQRNIDVSSVRAGSGIDPATLAQTIKDQLAEALAPLQYLKQQQDEHAANQELVEQVNQEITSFFQEFPDAQQHRPVLGAIMQQLEYTPREAWFVLQAQAHKNGWDLTKSLPEQAQRTTAANGGAAPTRGNSRLPPMNGRGGAGRGEPLIPAGSREVASHDASWDDIIRDTVDALPVRQ